MTKTKKDVGVSKSALARAFGMRSELHPHT